MELTLITAPPVEPVSLADARLQCRIAADDTAEDALLAVYIQAARQTAEHALGRVLITQTWEQAQAAFPAAGAGLRLGVARASVIVSVQYLDAGRTLRTLDAAAYALATDPLDHLLPAAGAAWPSTAADQRAVRVRYTAGYGATAAAVPAGVRQWLLLTVAAYHAQRESIDASGRVAALPARFVDRLLDAERLYL